jgi:hypothetical protein
VGCVWGAFLVYWGFCVGCGLIGVGQSIAPLYILNCMEFCRGAVFCMFLGVFGANRDLPPIGFCNEFLLGS